MRDFDLRNEAGEHSVVCTSSWVVINEETRRLVRPEDLAQFLAVDYEVDDAIAEPAPKVALPKDSEAECVAEHRVAFSDVDLIGHTNNARYVVWAMDCLPLSQTEQPLKDLYINFNKETKADELVQLYRLQDGTSWYVEGRVDGKSCFVVKLEY
jgi:acyl-ACP thioesterase